MNDRRNAQLSCLIIMLIAIGGWGRLARAQNFAGPEASATGFSGRAAVDPGEAPFLNPASVGFLSRYVASGYYGVDQHPHEGSANIWGVTLADGSSENIMPGALSYIHRRTIAPDGTGDTQQDIQITLSEAVSRSLSLGLQVHDQRDQLLSNFAGDEYSQWNTNLGLIYLPWPYLGLAVVAYDAFNITGDAPVGQHVVPTLAAAANLVYSKAFHARLDFIHPDIQQGDDRRINIAAGLETTFTDYFSFRVGGYWRETADETYITAGLGYNGPKLSIDYSFQQDTRNGYNYRHLIDLWIPL